MPRCLPYCLLLALNLLFFFLLFYLWSIVMTLQLDPHGMEMPQVSGGAGAFCNDVGGSGWLAGDQVLSIYGDISNKNAHVAFKVYVNGVKITNGNIVEKLDKDIKITKSVGTAAITEVSSGVWDIAVPSGEELKLEGDFGGNVKSQTFAKVLIDNIYHNLKYSGGISFRATDTALFTVANCE
jgi:hypothetical protein